MANPILNLVKRSAQPTPSVRIISTAFKSLQLPPPVPISNPPKSDSIIYPIPLLNPTIADRAGPVRPFEIYYPNFPFGYSLNPIDAAGFDQAEEDIEVGDAGTTLWADSVKKKRKKKMNKHKYQKLRKRLRRKSS
uniref:Small ribosomal subunit protein mS38 n=1 Tax=Rhizophora mucronata TaxID=61149 RepID=A0A2P2PKJ7_RHIMU